MSRKGEAHRRPTDVRADDVDQLEREARRRDDALAFRRRVSAWCYRCSSEHAYGERCR